MRTVNAIIKGIWLVAGITTATAVKLHIENKKHTKKIKTERAVLERKTKGLGKLSKELRVLNQREKNIEESLGKVIQELGVEKDKNGELIMETLNKEQDITRVLIATRIAQRELEYVNNRRKEIKKRIENEKVFLEKTK